MDYPSKLAKELHEMRKDAERYRWLRDTPWPAALAYVICNQCNARWDEFVDAAMRAEQFPGVDIDAVHRKA